MWNKKLLEEHIKEYANQPSSILELLMPLYKEISSIQNKDKIVVELGTRGGSSTRAILSAVNDTGGMLFTIDIDECKDCKKLMEGEPNIRFLQKDSVKAGDEWEVKVDVIFIDTEHKYDQLKRELEAWYPHMKPNCIMMFHDTENPKDNFGIRRALTEFISNHPEFKTKFYKEWSGLGILRRKK